MGKRVRMKAWKFWTRTENGESYGIYWTRKEAEESRCDDERVIQCLVTEIVPKAKAKKKGKVKR